MSDEVNLFYFSGYGEQKIKDFSSKEEAVSFINDSIELRQIRLLKYRGKNLRYMTDFREFVSKDEWIPFSGVEDIPIGTIWIIRWDSEEDEDGCTKAPWMIPAAVLTHRAWRGEKRICAGWWTEPQCGEINLSKAKVIAWMPRERPPGLPDDWQRFISDDNTDNVRF